MPRPLRFRVHDCDLPKAEAEVSAKLRGLKLELKMLRARIKRLSPKQLESIKPQLEPYLVQIVKLLDELEHTLTTEQRSHG